MSGILMMWLFLTTTCLIYGTLNAGGFFNLENEVNPEVWMNIVSHGKFQRTSKKLIMRISLGCEIIKHPVIAENL